MWVFLPQLNISKKFVHKHLGRGSYVAAANASSLTVNITTVGLLEGKRAVLMGMVAVSPGYCSRVLLTSDFPHRAWPSRPSGNYPQVARSVLVACVLHETWQVT